MLTKAKTQLLIRMPWFGIPLLKLIVKETDAVPTAATNSVELLYNKKFMEGLNLNQRKFVLAHEVLHVILGHTGQIMSGEFDRELANAAMDFVINLILVDAENAAQIPSEHGLPSGGFVRGGLYDESFRGMTWIQVYNKLLKSTQEMGEDSGSSSGSSSDLDVAGKEDVVSGYRGEQDVHDAATREFAEAIAREMAAVVKSCENLPAGIQRILGEILDPKLDWREILREFITGVASGKSDYTWRRPNRRFIGKGLYLPSLLGVELDKVVFAVDTSGSVSDAELSTACNELSGILEVYDPDTYVIWCDAEATVEKVELPLCLHPEGGGGTDFIPAFEEAVSISPDVMIYFTDGCCSSFPSEEPGFPVIWLVSNSHDFAPPFGEVLRIEVS